MIDLAVQAVEAETDDEIEARLGRAAVHDRQPASAAAVAQPPHTHQHQLQDQGRLLLSMLERQT